MIVIPFSIVCAQVNAQVSSLSCHFSFVDLFLSLLFFDLKACHEVYEEVEANYAH